MTLKKTAYYLLHVALLHFRTLSDLMFLSRFGNIDNILKEQNFQTNLTKYIF